MADFARLSINVNKETIAALQDIAAKRGQSVTETVRRATAVLKLLEDETAAGSKVILTVPGPMGGEADFHPSRPTIPQRHPPAPPTGRLACCGWRQTAEQPPVMGMGAGRCQYRPW